jgi:hypothetical protein
MKQEIEQQSNLLQTAVLLGAKYNKLGPVHHLQLPCGIPIELNFSETGLVFFESPGFHKVARTFESPRLFARKVQSYVWLIAQKWDFKNHPTQP